MEENFKMTVKVKKFLLTGGRSTSTLDLARQLHASGHRVFSADTSQWHVCSVSNAIQKNFVIPSPRFATKASIQALVDIVNLEKIDFLVPTYEEILYIAKYKDLFPKHCCVFSDSFETLRNLHNKWLFFCRQQIHGIKAPQTVLITSSEELKDVPFKKPYVLKACYSRASQSVIKVDPALPHPDIAMEAHNPWIAQEWLEGKKFCTYSICVKGIVQAHAIYPVQFAIDGNSCLNFEAVEHLEILQWIQNFAALENFTGQVGFDFFEMPDGTLYAIECNPRATNGLMLFKAQDRIDQAFSPDIPFPIYPKLGNSKQIAIGMLLYGWKSAYKEKTMLKYVKTLFKTPDAVFNWKDLKPFLSSPIIFCSYIYQSMKLRLNLPSLFTYDYNWDGDK